MKNEDFLFLQKLLKDESGLVVTPEKMYLIESRLLPVAQKAGLSGLDDVIFKLRTPGNGDLKRKVIEAMTTNETSFFRDITPFEKFKNILLPYFMNARATNKQLRIWSAACSSGQEPYTLAMMLKENEAKLAGWKIDILATDLSEDILDQARQAAYTQFEAQRGLPIQLLVKNFEQRGDRWYLRDDIKNMVTFRRFNLLDDFSSFGTFDIILCRNVLIYFDVPLKAKILNGMHKILARDGVLFLGGAETVIGVTDSFKALTEHRGLYVRSDTAFKTAATPVLASSS